MPIVEVNKIFRPEHVVEHFYNDFMENASILGLNYVGKYGERLVPAYPAVVVSSAPMLKEVHGTHTFLMELRCIVFVFHAEMKLTQARRSYEDLALATQIVDFMERNFTLGNRIIFGFVESEVPGAKPARNRSSDVVVSTQLTWMGAAERRFK